MATSLSPTLILPLLVTLVQFNSGAVSSTSIDTFLFGGCSQLKYTPGSPYESTLNSLLTSIVNSASFSLYNNFTSSSSPTISALYQCRGDLPPADCTHCIAKAITQLGTLCPSSCGGALQLDGCLVRYDNVTFLGVQDKTVLFRKCGADSGGYNDDESRRRNAVLDYVAGGGSGGVYRVGGSGDVFAVAQCVQDLSRSECQDCISEAVGELKSVCGGASAWGDMFLGKCYARFSEGGAHSRGGGGGGGQGKSNNNNNSDEEIEKTLAILIGLIAGVALLIVFLSCLRKLCDKGKGGK